MDIVCGLLKGEFWFGVILVLMLVIGFLVEVIWICYFELNV